ncbi:hypothetical protein [Gelidibacter mesophilus]|uniref:hypothetical protein n=1 Tax=Gelidibacter mesophilus TaxID=169050 RepID=UPI000414190D|nr:hypothetical protein [Gelidibacter mesophilus]
MVKQKKILFIIPDGVSLRNFVYTSFYQEAQSTGITIVFLNLTSFSLATLGLDEVVPQPIKQHPLTDSFKNAKKRIELNQFIKRFKDPVYQKYWFDLSYRNFSAVVKSSITQLLVTILNSAKGLGILRKQIRFLERQTSYYTSCKEILETLQPDLVYCASQRSILAIAPIEAAKALGIPTIGFVYSWDNLPKSMVDVETDHYHVWSDHMQQELLTYYPFVRRDQITVTGTPQFEPHYNSVSIPSRDGFYAQHGLNLAKDYICFSGDDITTSPQDPLYLRDVARAVRTMNTNNDRLGILFRRCPVDFSDRFDAVLKEFEDVIIPISPLWKSVGEGWNTKLPTKADTVLLATMATHCKAVFNLGSSMVFDFAIHNKPCGYMNYRYNTESMSEKGVHVYDYVHFRSMPNSDAVFWIDSPQMISESIERMLKDSSEVVSHAQAWFEHINKAPFHETSSRIVTNISQRLQKPGV